METNLVQPLKVDVQSIFSVAVKALPWAFFVSALKFAVGSLIGNMQLVTKIYFPRVIFPLSYVASQLFDLCVAGAFFAIFFVFSGIGLSVYILWLPVLVL